MTGHPPPTRAMVLAAGLGTRMRPLTETMPKPLVRVAGQPLIDHALDRLAAAGVTDAVVNVHYLADQLEAHLSTRTQPRIHISDERAQLLDTGGGIRRALEHFNGAPFYLANADSLWVEGAKPNLLRLAEAFDPEKMDALLLVAASTGATGYAGRGDFALDPVGKLRRRVEKEVVPFVYTGYGILSPRLFDPAPVDAAFSLNILFDAALARGRLHGLRLDGVWMHVGTPDAVELAEQVIAEEVA